VIEGQPDPRDLFALWGEIAQIRPSLISPVCPRRTCPRRTRDRREVDCIPSYVVPYLAWRAEVPFVSSFNVEPAHRHDNRNCLFGVAVIVAVEWADKGERFSICETCRLRPMGAVG
jgi:hypothetical protein